MTVGHIATIKVKEGKEKDFENLFLDFAPHVLAEQGYIRYDLCKMVDEPGTYCVIHMYETVETREAHQNTEHGRRFGAELEPLLAGNLGGIGRRSFAVL